MKIVIITTESTAAVGRNGGRGQKKKTETFRLYNILWFFIFNMSTSSTFYAPFPYTDDRQDRQINLATVPRSTADVLLLLLLRCSHRQIIQCLKDKQTKINTNLPHQREHCYIAYHVRATPCPDNPPVVVVVSLINSQCTKKGLRIEVTPSTVQIEILHRRSGDFNATYVRFPQGNWLRKVLSLERDYCLDTRGFGRFPNRKDLYLWNKTDIGAIQNHYRLRRDGRRVKENIFKK